MGHGPWGMGPAICDPWGMGPAMWKYQNCYILSMGHSPCGPGPHGAQKKHGAQTKHKKGRHFINKCRFGEVFQVPGKYVLFGVISFGKLIGFIAHEMVPWLSKKTKDQSGGPRTHLEVIGDEVSFQYFPKTWKSTSPMPFKTKPRKVRGNRFVWSMPCPWTPPDLLNSI